MTTQKQSDNKKSEEKETSRPLYHEEIIQLDTDTIRIGKREYSLKKNYKDAFQVEKMRERYSDILNRYDYVVGDWGFDQLRLRGFFNEKNRSALPDTRINTLDDYLYEYCNFGCAYFVIEKKGSNIVPEKKNDSQQKKKKPSNAYIAEKKVPIQSNKKKEIVLKNRSLNKQKNKPDTNSEVNVVTPKSKRNFTIRQKGK